ncbi:uncharacterized protein LOC134812569 [Bolinopsis microptera]|uniref:uncharacterized protein LOC134812569 n=1 Tax=Bolinopsis microptera TaxID=2820187 RepID=UPI003078F71E
MMRKVCRNLSGAGRSVLLNRIRDSRRQISMARPTDNGGDQGTGGQTNWYTRYLILGPAGATGAVLTGKDDEENELLEAEDLEFEIAQAGESKFRKTRLFKHFCSFASIKYKTEMYMTADDFFTASKGTF